jgi:hypothetical protein
MKTTKAQLAIFQKECERLIEVLGLKRYAYYYGMQELGERQAVTCMNVGGGVMTLLLNDEYDEDFNPKRIAKHEMAHVLTAKLEQLASCRFIDNEEVDEEMEVIANILERVL